MSSASPPRCRSTAPPHSLAAVSPRCHAPHCLTCVCASRRRYQVVSWDQTLRDDVGAKLANLFPKLPDRGTGARKVSGKDRSFAHSLQFTASNARKTMNINNENYKSRMVAPLSALDENALSLIQTTSYPVRVEQEGGESIGQFEKGVMQGVANFMMRTAGEHTYMFEPDAQLLAWLLA